ncbi:hypothetical protein CARUB_v10002831mg [Capsella rubella]|uniref:Homeobox-leucine zipper protein n=2 Tax=Capsella rubella TaxID=81985 RepID=R0HB51_9BRAS|nr:hypothetical protein CARUB_v10002831mg [Capsella rubella]
MEWSMTNNVQNKRADSLPQPQPWLESNYSNSLCSVNYNPYAGNSSCNKPAYTQTGPVISIPESEKIIFKAYQCDPGNNNEMIRKNKRLASEQLASLELRFQEDFRLDTERKFKLAEELGLEPRQVAVWFQNRRARWKVKHLEESYDSLRQEYDAVWREKQMLHDEV